MIVATAIPRPRLTFNVQIGSNNFSKFGLILVLNGGGNGGQAQSLEWAELHGMDLKNSIER